MLKPRPFENARKRCSRKKPQIVGTALEETCFEIVDPAGPPQKASGPESGGHPSHDGRLMRYKLAALVPIFACTVYGREKHKDHFALANSYAAATRWDQATSEYRAALLLRLVYPEAHYNLGIVLAAVADLRAAELQYRSTLLLRPD